MNKYSLESDSRRWWWPSGLAGGAGVVSVTALFILGGGTPSSAHPDGDSPVGLPYATTSVETSAIVHCFARRHGYPAWELSPPIACGHQRADTRPVPTSQHGGIDDDDFMRRAAWVY